MKEPNYNVILDIESSGYSIRGLRKWSKICDQEVYSSFNSRCLEQLQDLRIRQVYAIITDHEFNRLGVILDIDLLINFLISNNITIYSYNVLFDLYLILSYVRLYRNDEYIFKCIKRTNLICLQYATTNINNNRLMKLDMLYEHIFNSPFSVKYIRHTAKGDCEGLYEIIQYIIYKNLSTKYFTYLNMILLDKL